MTLNLLLLANGPSANLPVIIDKYQKVNYVGLISNQDPGYRKNDYFFYRDCVFGVYDENEYSKNISIGKDLLHELMLCESQFMKMMERFEQWGGLHAYEHRINLYHKQLKHWYGYLTKNKINLCVFHTIPHFGYDFIIYSLCKIINIKVVMFQRIPVLIGHNVSLYAFDDLEKHIVGLKERYEYYLKHPRKIELEPRFSEYFSLQKSNSGKTFTGASVKHRNTFVNTLMTLVRAIKTRLPVWKLYKRYYRWHDIFSRAIQLISLFEHTKIQYVKCPDTDINYIFVPLHYQPEASTSPLGDVFVYQDLMIDILDQGLPDNYRIYVKPHMRPGNISKFFRRINFSERVIFVDSSENSLDLIQKSIATATVTGTAGWEAVLNKKPVLMFGNYFYQDAPGVYKVGTVDEVRQAVEYLEEDRNSLSDEKVSAFLAALQDCTFPGWVDNRYADLSDLSVEENNSNIAKAIINCVDM